MRILLVEDEPRNRELVKAILSTAADTRVRSAIVVEAATLAGARSAVSTGLVDLVLLDVQLPDGSGLNLATEVRARPGPARQPAIIAVTAGALAEQQAAAIAAGCDAVITKPYTADELERVLSECADARAIPDRERR